MQFGFYLEQQTQRSLNLSANGLCQLMPQLVNRQLSQLDINHPILSYDANGVFLDTIKYNRLVNEKEQTSFDRTFRRQLIANGAKDANGVLINERSIIDVNSYAPSDFNLKLFTADELLNNGNGYVIYFGYDHLGNKTHGKFSTADFLQDLKKRSINAFMPIYAAAWLQDQFRFKDLVFRLGLRLEQYDANQFELKDPWSLFPIQTAKELNMLNGVLVQHPSKSGMNLKCM